MKNTTYLILSIFLVLLIIFNVPAQAAMVKVGQTGAQFLKIDASARAVGMGSAYIMLGRDASAVFYNPACLDLMEQKYDFFANRTQWVADISYYHMSLAGKLPNNMGTVALSSIFADYGYIEGTLPVAKSINPKGYIETGDIDCGSYAFGLTYSKQINSKFTIGGQLKYIGQNLGWTYDEKESSGNGTVLNDDKINNSFGFAYDFGTIYYPGWKSFRFGMSIRNFSQEFDFDVGYPGSEENEGRYELPLTFIMGAAIDLMDFVKISNQSLILAIDAIHPRDYTERMHIGAEYWYNDKVALRGGYKFNYDEESITFGGGIKIMGVKVDYAYSALKTFDSVNRFSIGYSF